MLSQMTYYHLEVENLQNYYNHPHFLTLLEYQYEIYRNFNHHGYVSFTALLKTEKFFGYFLFECYFRLAH